MHIHWFVSNRSVCRFWTKALFPRGWVTEDFWIEAPTYWSTNVLNPRSIFNKAWLANYESRTWGLCQKWISILPLLQDFDWNVILIRMLTFSLKLDSPPDEMIKTCVLIQLDACLCRKCDHFTLSIHTVAQNNVHIQTYTNIHILKLYCITSSPCFSRFGDKTRKEL